MFNDQSYRSSCTEDGIRKHWEVMNSSAEEPPEDQSDESDPGSDLEQDSSLVPESQEPKSGFENPNFQTEYPSDFQTLPQPYLTTGNLLVQSTQPDWLSSESYQHPSDVQTLPVPHLMPGLPLLQPAPILPSAGQSRILQPNLADTPTLLDSSDANWTHPALSGYPPNAGFYAAPTEPTSYGSSSANDLSPADQSSSLPHQPVSQASDAL